MTLSLPPGAQPSIRGALQSNRDAMQALRTALVHSRATRKLRSIVMRSAIADVAGGARDRYRMLHAAYRDPETLGTLTNDQLAGWLVARLCRRGGRFVDVGAHVGSVVGAALRHGEDVRVVAIEAIERKAAFLRATFPDVQVHHCAAGPHDTTVTFFVNRVETAYSSLGRPARGAANDIEAVQVPMRTLDCLVTPEGVDVIKIDVEGAELGVLRGAEQLLSACRPILMFESGPAHEDGLGYSKSDLWYFLARRDYGIYVPNRLAHHGGPLSLCAFEESHHYPRRTTNYFAVPHERREAFRDRARALLGL